MTERRPKWRQVADDLRAQISSGTPGPGERLPAEPELAEQYGVGRGTVRAALDILEGEGLLTRRPKVGTVVRDRTVVDLPLRRAGDALQIGDRSWSQTVEAAGLTPQVKTGQVRRESAGQAADSLQVSPDSEVTVGERTMLADGAPLQLQETTWAQADLSGADLDDLHDALRSAGRQPAEATERIATRQATPEEAAALQVPVGAPVLEVHRVTYDETGHPLEVLVAVSSDRVRYLIERTPVAPED